MAASTPVLRYGARVILLDAADRVLLFASVNELTGEPFWVPPGGGREGAESAETTARREVFEETGFATIELLGEIGTRQYVATWGGVTYDSRERWFLARVPVATIDTSRFTELERTLITGHHWWSVAELHQATERLVPPDLAALVETLLRDGLPATLLELQ